MRETLAEMLQRIPEAARLMVGVPDYPTYLRHLREQHPEREPMSFEEFFRNRQAARYGSGQGRCC